MRFQPPRRRTLPAAIFIAALAMLVLASTAFALITVYKNPFSSKDRAHELKRISGDFCQRNWFEKKKMAKITITQGDGNLANSTCVYRIPIEAETAQPDHRLDFEAKLTDDTPSSIRDTAFVGMHVRDGGGNHYDLTVFPRIEDCTLTRVPLGPPPFATANACDNAAILEEPNKANKLGLEVFGSQVRVIVNGVELLSLTDTDPGALVGRKLALFFGQTDIDARATVFKIDNVKLRCPDVPVGC